MKLNPVSPRAGAFRALAKTILFAALLSSAIMWLAPPLHAADRRWTGNASGLWSNPNNWSPAGVPLNGEHILFEGDGRTTQNDLSGLSLSKLEFLRGEWRITGNELMITGSIPVGALNDSSEENLITIDCPLILGGRVVSRISWGRDDPVFDNPNHVTFRGPINLNGHEFEVFLENCGCGPHPFASILGAVSGSGTLRISSLSRNPVEIGGAEPNTFIGPLICELAGAVVLNKLNGPAVNTMLDVNCGDPVSIRRPGQIASGATVRIGAGSQLRLEGHDVTLTDLDIGSLGTFSVGEPVSVLDMQGATIALLGNLRSRAFIPTFAEGSPATPVLEGRVVLPNGTHTFDIFRRDVSFYGLELRAEITGAGGFTKTGDAALLLRTNNTFTGSVSVEEGIVEARHPLAFGTTAGGVTLANGSVTLNDVTVSGETLFVRGTRSITANTDGSLLNGQGLSGWLGRIELDTNLVIISGDQCLLGGPVVGPGGFEFLGSRHLLSGASVQPNPSTFTGLTRVLCDLLQVGEQRPFRGPVVVGGGFGGPHELRWDFGALNSGGPSEVTVHPNGLVNLNGHDETFPRLIFHGGRVVTGAGILAVARIITHPTNVTASFEGKLLLSSSPLTEFTVADGPASPDLAISAVVSDGPNTIGIVKTGDGELRLSGANTYDGTTRIDAGVVHIQNNTSLGTPGVGTTVRDGATLQIEFVGALAEPLNIRGAGRGGTLGALNLMAATGVQAGIVMAGPSTVRVDTQFAILSSVISGTGPFTKIGAGTLQFGGGGGSANTYTGDTFVEAGVLVPSKGTGVTTVPGHLIIGGGGGLLGVSAIVRHFAGTTVAGSVTVSRGGLWDLNGFSEDFNVALLESRPALTLNDGGDVQTGAGTLVLPAAGDVVVDPGGVVGASSFVSGNLVLQPGAHRFVVQNGASIIGLDITELDVSAVVSQQPLGAAEIVKEGVGEMRLSGANTFTGQVTANAGLLTAAHTNALGTTAAGTFVNSTASLALDGGISVGFEPLTLDTTSAAALISLGPVTNIWRGNVTLQRTASIVVPDSTGVLRFESFFGCCPSVITGPGGLTKSGPGAVIITGTIANNYTGPTTVNDGLLEASRTQGPALSSDVLVSGANSILRTGRTPAPQALPTAARMTVQNGALWTMNPTTTENLSSLLGDGRVEIGASAALTISNGVSCEFSGQVSGSGALNKRGLATLHVTGQSPDYTGPATVFDGTYKVDGYFANSPVTVKPSSVLRGSGAVGDVTVENGGVVRVDPRNPGYLGGSMQFNSVNFLSGGVLGAQFYGPHPTGGNDLLYVLNGVTLGTPALSSGFGYPPHEGDVITLVEKIATGAITGAFSGFPEGALRFIGGIPVVASYVGGNGNDMTLTVTNLPLRGGGTQLVAGLGGSALVPDDCSQLSLVVTNRGAVALTGLRGKLRSLTPGVVVTMAESSYTDLAPNARGSNATPFQIRTEPSFACGGGAEFELILTASNFPPTAIAYTMPGASGFGLDLDGRDDQVEVSRTTFAGVVNNFSIELWVYPRGNRTETAETNAGISGVNVPLRQLQRFAVFPDRGNLAYGVTHVSAGLSIGRNGISVYEHGTNQVQAAIHLPSRLVYSNTLSGWTHVALVYASRRPQLYVNGALVRSSSAQSLFPNVHPSGSLGGSSQADFGNFQGQLDEVRIWNVALNQTQIQSNMTRSLTGTEPNLVTYFRCDEGGGSQLTDSAPASPNPSGTLTDGAAFVFAGVVPFGECAPGGGACESCLVVSGHFDTNALETVRRLTATGLPSVCDPPKPCPGFEEFPDAPVLHVLHHFTNSTAAELCVTAQLLPNCPGLPADALGVAAYVGEFRINQPCSFYLGDDGAADSINPPFSFRVPPQTNFLLVVTARTTNFVCDNYTLELFGLPCPPPTLHIAKDAAPDKVLLHWSTSSPGFTLQTTNTLRSSGPNAFLNVPTTPSIVNGHYTVTNTSTAPRHFFRLSR